ncbi:MAG: hypothetical protein ABIQ40_18910 [Bacteroidia bacterium]
MEEITDEYDVQKRLSTIPEKYKTKAEELLKSGRKLKALGFWKGTNTGTELPHPEIFQDVNWDVDDKMMVIAYLKRSSPVVPYMGLSHCRFNCGEGSMGACDMSDGTYCWPEGLPHYLERHAVRLPEEFVKHVYENRNTPVTPAFDTDIQSLWFLAPDFNWWKSQKGIAI